MVVNSASVPRQMSWKQSLTLQIFFCFFKLRYLKIEKTGTWYAMLLMVDGEIYTTKTKQYKKDITKSCTVSLVHLAVHLSSFNLHVEVAFAAYITGVSFSIAVMN